MNGLKNIIRKLPDPIKQPLESLPEKIQDNIEEIRIQTGQPMRVITGSEELIIKIKGTTAATQELLETVLNNLLNYSIYAYEEELARGYLTIEGGHRVGVCGRAVTDNGKVTLIKDISSLNIRHSREIPGVAYKIIDEIYSQERGLQNTIIVSPPKCGKTTLLRDIVRILSENGLQVSVCDERSEIAGMYQGMPSYDIGPRTDVLDGCLKAEGMLMMIRSMAPDVLVTDEIGRSEDIEALESAVSAGVNIITTIHGRTYEDLTSSQLGNLIKQRIFTRIIFLTNIPSTGTVSEVRHV